MYKSLREIRTGETAYFAVFSLYTVLPVLQYTFYKSFLPRENLMNGILLICLAVLAVREVLFETMDLSSVLLLAAALVFAANSLISGTFWTAFPFILIFCGRNISPRRLFTFAGALTLALMAFVVLSAFGGIIENYRRIEVNRENNREYLGFLFALYPGFLFLNAASLIVAVRGRRIHFITLASIGAISFLIYRKTDGRLAFFLTLLLLVFACFMRVFPDLLRSLKALFFLAVPAFPAAAVVSAALTFSFNPSVRWMYRLDLMLDHRISYGQASIRQFGLHLIGTSVNWVGYGLDEAGNRSLGDYLYVDNAFVGFLQRFGWIAFILVVVLGTAALFRLYLAGRYELLFIFLLITIHALLDNLVLQLIYNTFWIAAAHSIAARPVKEVWDYESIT